MPGERILSKTIDSLNDTTLDMARYTHECRYRLISCDAFVNDRLLRVYEFTDFPSVKYSAISYVWRGNPASRNPSSPNYWQDRDGTFTVKGAEDGDPISLDVFFHVCSASLAHNIRFIWLDRLCVLQTSKKDKSWQIRAMYSIYDKCDTCFVLPGGIRRLVGLNEETAWIQRAWTLQETVVPQRVMVVFAWKYGRTEVKNSPSKLEPRSIIAGDSAQEDIMHILHASTTKIQLVDANTGRVIITGPQITVFGSSDSSPARFSLIGALNRGGISAKEQNLWRCALMRTSSRPVDMVFSIMQLFGVTLDPSSFGKDDRLGATIALAQGILRKGGKAHWLGAWYQLEPSRELPSFPRFPATSVEGKAYLVGSDGRRHEVAKFVKSKGLSPYAVSGVPKGTMSNDGALVFSAKAILIRPWSSSTSNGETILTASDGSKWIVNARGSKEKAKFRTFAVLLGKQLISLSANFIQTSDRDPIRAMILAEHEHGKYHRKSYFKLPSTFQDLFDSASLRQFHLGPR
ncbi:hypothetical protein C8Q75DRAFT_355828 [Abortiporus biennis]|nr:hypothetical protein C8Q75DRAFT_355828 [Abortiporus biennis]